MLNKIVSGAQTGVDRAALDAAMLLNFEYGGWCPKGRLDEKGAIPEKYQHLKKVSGKFETDKENYDARTRKNIEDSDPPETRFPQALTGKNHLTLNCYILVYQHNKAL